MYDLKWIRANPETFNLGLKRRGLEPISSQVFVLDEKYRLILARLQELQTERNLIAKKFAEIKKEGGDTSLLNDKIVFIKQEMPHLEVKLRTAEDELNNFLSTIPNTPAYDCFDGKDEDDNIEIYRFGEPKKFNFSALQHFDLGEKLGQMDFERAAKLSGSRFVVLYDDLARLERALASFMIDIHISEFGYQEVQVPYLVNEKTVYGACQLPKFKEDLFKTTTGHWLISTGEVPLANLMADEILQEKDLPLRFTAYTPCFRSEAGAAGRDTRGMIRQHQFSKVELVSIVCENQAVSEHDRMTTAARTILERLEIPYRVMSLCTGDMGFHSEKTYDIEVWLPGQNVYREISSCSRCHTFQARRMNIRYRKQDDSKKLLFPHTLNGSGLAVGRTIVAIMENYQQEDGSILIPKKLQQYMGGKKVIKIKKREE